MQKNKDKKVEHISKTHKQIILIKLSSSLIYQLETARVKYESVLIPSTYLTDAVEPTCPRNSAVTYYYQKVRFLLLKVITNG